MERQKVYDAFTIYKRESEKYARCVGSKKIYWEIIISEQRLHGRRHSFV